MITCEQIDAMDGKQAVRMYLAMLGKTQVELCKDVIGLKYWPSSISRLVKGDSPYSPLLYFGVKHALKHLIAAPAHADVEYAATPSPAILVAGDKLTVVGENVRHTPKKQKAKKERKNGNAETKPKRGKRKYTKRSDYWTGTADDLVATPKRRGRKPKLA